MDCWRDGRYFTFYWDDGVVGHCVPKDSHFLTQSDKFEEDWGSLVMKVRAFR